MKVALVAPFEESVPPKSYGGTELVAANLIKGLVTEGHDVTLLATGDSVTDAKLVPIFPESIRALPDAQDGRMREAMKYLGLGRVVEHLNEHQFDIIHNHIGWRLLPYEKLLRGRLVTTLHGPMSPAYQQLVYSAAPSTRYISISDAQRQPMPNLNYIATVYNGIEVDRFAFTAQPKDYYAFLGRMSPEKGAVQAIQIAKKAGVRLKMAAKIDAVDNQYFEEEVRPLIDGDQVQFIGEVNHEQKVSFLGEAIGLIAPIQWEEPFGLFFVEAMVCGTPVFTMRRGSTPELIIDGQTGFLCDSEDEMAAWIARVGEIKRQTCHDHAYTHFGIEAMTRGYLQAYHRALT